MLVLSRGRNDKVVFPTLGITVQILRVEGKNIRLGIDAPKSVPILREEIAAQVVPGDTVEDQPESGRLTHAMRNRLQKAALGLRMLQRMLDAGEADDAEPTIFKIFTELKEIEDDLSKHRAPREVLANSCGGRRALVVEDDANERELLAGYLRLSGFEVETAMDGLQAMVHLAKSERLDVVLLDMKMPRFDGRKTVSAIRQNPDHKTLKIFAVTGTSPVEAAVGVGPDGVNRWFTKPVDPVQLVHAMQVDLTQQLAPA
jgi:carbon storage regulator CsrA